MLSIFASAIIGVRVNYKPGETGNRAKDREAEILSRTPWPTLKNVMLTGMGNSGIKWLIKATMPGLERL